MTESSSGPADHEQDLIAERGVNEQYLRFLNELVARKPALTVGAPRNNIWTDRAPKSSVSSRVIHPIYGRVSLDDTDEFLTDSFYIGTWHNDTDGVVVISWASPAAELFFAGRDCDYELAGGVLGRRTFVHRDTDIEDFVDDLEPDVDPSGVFSPGGKMPLAVPKAPGVVRPQRKRRAIQPEEKGSAPSADAQPDVPEPRAHVQQDPPQAYENPRSAPEEIDLPSSVPDVSAANLERAKELSDSPLPLRAEAAVRTVLERPRTGRLTSVLATLQPEQYRLVTWPDDRLLIVQGQPGTGKTIIATHRAAFLTHPERDGREPLRRVLVVGPTDEYRAHVVGALDDLGGVGITAHSLQSLMQSLVGIPAPQKIERDQRLDTSWVIGRVVDKAERELRRTRRLTRGPDRDLMTLVDELVKDTPTHRLITGQMSDGAEISAWLLGLKSFSNAKHEARALPFLSCAALAVGKLRTGDRFDHLVIDEAQDVRPLEWKVLLEFLSDGGSVSLFGDMNQRRSDWSFASWQSLIDEVDLMADSSGFEPEVLTTGFRSTRQILQFANQLLPARERIIHSLRDGMEPRVEKVRRDDLLRSTIGSAEQLATKHPDGLVAVITVAPRETANGLRSAGWKPGRIPRSFVRDGRVIIPLHPVQARGLEFDGVVVVEPSNFPQNLGRDGLLYTSLTRATKELVVVYTKSLPKGLRKRR